MTSSKEKKLFRFLKEINAYKPFLENYDTTFLYNGKETIHSSIKITSLESLINYAFEWNVTPQGDNFWYSVHKTWLEYVGGKIGISKVREFFEKELKT